MICQVKMRTIVLKRSWIRKCNFKRFIDKFIRILITKY